MNRSSIIAVGLLVLGTYALVRAQVATPLPEAIPTEAPDRSEDEQSLLGRLRHWDPNEIRQREEDLSSLGDLDGAISLLQDLKKNADLTSALTPAEREVLANLVALQKLKEKRDAEVQSHQESQALGRFQLIGESGWIYRIDTATGEVVGMPVGAQAWNRMVRTVEANSEETSVPPWDKPLPVVTP